MNPIMQTHAGLIVRKRDHSATAPGCWSLEYWCPERERTAVNSFQAESGPWVNRKQPDGVEPGLMPAAADALARWNEREDRAALARILASAIARGQVFRGDRVEVMRGRIVPRGTTGVVLYARDVSQRYSHARFAGLKDQYGRTWEVREEYLRVIQRGPILQDLFDYAD